jgi:hypothetical protein
MQQTDGATPGDSGPEPSREQGAAAGVQSAAAGVQLVTKAQAGDARSVQAMPRLLLVVTAILLCLRLAAFVMQSQSPGGNPQKTSPANPGTEL